MAAKCKYMAEVQLFAATYIMFHVHCLPHPDREDKVALEIAKKEMTKIEMWFVTRLRCQTRGQINVHDIWAARLIQIIRRKNKREQHISP